jgi:hypothetical protein
VVQVCGVARNNRIAIHISTVEEDNGSGELDRRRRTGNHPWQRRSPYGWGRPVEAQHGAPGARAQRGIQAVPSPGWNGREGRAASHAAWTAWYRQVEVVGLVLISKRQRAEVECNNEVDVDSRSGPPSVHKRQRTKVGLPCNGEDLHEDDELHIGGLEVLGTDELELLDGSVAELKLDDNARKGFPAAAASTSADIPGWAKPAVRLLVSVHKGLIAARTSTHTEFVGARPMLRQQLRVRCSR